MSGVTLHFTKELLRLERDTEWNQLNSACYMIEIYDMPSQSRRKNELEINNFVRNAKLMGAAETHT